MVMAVGKLGIDGFGTVLNLRRLFVTALMVDR
jgi:hypothetical protein